VVGFYGEGVRDYAFVMRVVERTVQELAPHIDVFAQGVDFEREG
jgi:hypothetical protein